MVRRTDQEIKMTGRTAFMMGIDLTSHLAAAGKDPRELKFREFGFKRAQQEWNDKQTPWRRKPAFRSNPRGGNMPS